MVLARCVLRALRQQWHSCPANAARSERTTQSATLAMPGLPQQDSQLAACDPAPGAASGGSMRFSTATPMPEQYKAPPTWMCHDFGTAHSYAVPCKQGLLSSCIGRQFSSLADAMLPAPWQQGNHLGNVAALKSDGQLTAARHAAGAASLVQPHRRMCAGAEAQRAPAAYCINVYTGRCKSCSRSNTALDSCIQHCCLALCTANRRKAAQTVLQWHYDGDRVMTVPGAMLVQGMCGVPAAPCPQSCS